MGRKVPGLTKRTQFFWFNINFIRQRNLHQEQRNHSSAALTFQYHFCRNAKFLTGEHFFQVQPTNAQWEKTQETRKEIGNHEKSQQTKVFLM